MIAFRRWVVGMGRDVVVAAILNELTYWSYILGFPGPGRWLEVFDSDVYDHWVNPIVAGNGSGVNAAPLSARPALFGECCHTGQRPRCVCAVEVIDVMSTGSCGPLGVMALRVRE